jgi:hypothetical protein
VADVFISYAGEDTVQAERLARALEEEGLEGLWDVDSLRSRESLSQSINRALESAKRVLVLWSASSIASKWVDAEALQAWEQDKLHSVWLAEEVAVRVPFNASHARNLVNWDGSADFPEFRRLVADIRALAEAQAKGAAGAGASTEGRLETGQPGLAKGRRGIALKLLGLAAPTVIALVVALLLMQWHRPTRVELALTVDRMSLTVAQTPAEGPAALMDSGRMGLIHAEQVALVHFEPDSLEIADESRYDHKSGRFPDDAWRPLAFAGRAVLLEPLSSSGGLEPSVILQSEDPASPGLIKVVRAQPGTEAVIELGMEEGGSRPWVTLDIAERPAQIKLVFLPGRLLLFADYMRLKGIQGARLKGIQGATGSPDTLSLCAQRATNTPVSILGSAHRMRLAVEPVGSAETLLSDGQIPVSAVDFTRQGPTGDRRSSLVGSGTLSYPDLPGKALLALKPGEFASLGGLQKARIKSLSVDKGGGRIGLRLILDAVASRLRVGTPEHAQDARLTGFDWVRHQPTLTALFAVVVWFFTTTLAGYKLWQELRLSRTSS